MHDRQGHFNPRVRREVASFAFDFSRDTVPRSSRSGSFGIAAWIVQPARSPFGFGIDKSAVATSECSSAV